MKINGKKGNWGEWKTAGDVEKHWGLVLIDHQPGERRRIDVDLLRDRAELIVVHDTEFHGYKYNFSIFE